MPVLEKVDTNINQIQALVLVPTRELALQTSQVCRELGKYMECQVCVVTGGTNLKEDILRLQQTVHVLVATPGRVLDLSDKNIAKLANASLLVSLAEFSIDNGFIVFIAFNLLSFFIFFYIFFYFFHFSYCGNVS